MGMQRQENTTVLLDLLESYDFYSRLYSLQLMSAISSARPERTQECVATSPVGVSRLVAVLDDKREAVRSGMHTKTSTSKYIVRFTLTPYVHRGSFTAYIAHTVIIRVAESRSLRECL